MYSTDCVNYTISFGWPNRHDGRSSFPSCSLDILFSQFSFSLFNTAERKEARDRCLIFSAESSVSILTFYRMSYITLHWVPHVSKRQMIIADDRFECKVCDVLRNPNFCNLFPGVWARRFVRGYFIDPLYVFGFGKTKLRRCLYDREKEKGKKKHLDFSLFFSLPLYVDLYTKRRDQTTPAYTKVLPAVIKYA
jgi:hypothetical protein